MTVATLTYALPLRPDPGQATLLESTCDRYLKACDLVSRWCRTNRDLKQRHVQDGTYATLRGGLGLPSQMAISATRRVIGNYRTIRENQGSPWATKEAPRYTSPGYDLVWNRDYSILPDGRLSLNTLQGRIKLGLDWTHVPMRFRKSRFGTARILPRRGKWMLIVPMTIDINDPAETQDVMGVDLGMRFLAVTYDSHGKAVFYPGKEVTQKRAQYRALRTGLQKRGTRSARRRLKAIGSRENRWMRDINHQVSKALVNQCQNPTLIVLEDLKGIRRTTERVRKSRRYVQVSWAFFQLKTMIEYKAKLAGHAVMYIDPAYTSQACPICGKIRKSNRRKKTHEYICANCGYHSNDDRVAAMNIRQRGYNSLLESVSGTPDAEGRSQSSHDVPPAPAKGNKGRRQSHPGRPTIATAGQGQTPSVRAR